jgi:RimJ/RimL family protein N-acetyltransferase
MTPCRGGPEQAHAWARAGEGRRLGRGRRLAPARFTEPAQQATLSSRSADLKAGRAYDDGVALTEPDPRLTASGVVLRPPGPADAEWIAAACADPEMGRYAPALPHPYLPAHARAFVEHSQQGWRDGTHAVFAIVDRVAGDGLGIVELHLGRRSEGLGAIGYWLARGHRGHGHATAAVRLVAEWAFEGPGVERLEITADPENTPSIRVAERAGFERTAYLPAWMETRDGPRDRVLLCRVRR